jgi:hypothetical protein
VEAQKNKGPDCIQPGPFIHVAQCAVFRVCCSRQKWLLRVESGLAGFDDSLEASRLAQSEIGQDLTVQLDAGALEAADELGVAHAHEAGARVDTGDPQGAVVTTTLATAAVGSGPGVADLLDGIAELATAREVEALSVLENTVATAAGLEAPFSARHDEDPS